MFVNLFFQTYGQTSVDSLDIYDPFEQIVDIRRIVANELSILGSKETRLIEEYESQLRVYKKGEQDSLTSIVLLKIGDIYFRGAIYDMAMDAYYNALEIYEKINDSLSIARTKIKLFRTYYFADLTAKSNYLLEAEEILNKYDDPASLALLHYAQSSLTKDDVERKMLRDKAVTIQSLVVSQAKNDTVQHLTLASFLNASGHYEEAIDMAQRFGDDWLVVLFLNNLGYKYVLDGEYDKAIKYFEQSHKLSKKGKFKTLLRNVYENLSRAYRIKGDWKKAAYYLQLMKIVSESLYTEGFTYQMNSVQLKHDAQRRAFENELLRSEKKLLAESVSKEKLLNTLLILLIIGIVVILFYVFLINRKLKTVNTALDKQNIDIQLKQNELRELYESLQQSEKNLKDAQATAHLADWQYVLKTKEFLFSEQFPIIFGTEKELIKEYGLSYLFEISSPDDSYLIKAFLGVDTLPNDEHELDFKVNLLDNYKWIKIKKVLVRNDDAEIVSLFGTVQDISDLKEKEENKIKFAEQQSFNRKLIDYLEEERKRIAGDLHDGLGQNILLIKNRAMLSLQNNSIDDESRRQLKEINSLSSNLLDIVKEISFNLRPAHLERLGLTDTIISSIETAKEIGILDLNFNIDQIDNLLDHENEIHVFRILQEGINNILKHSEAESASISILRENSRIIIIISDDGKGFDVKLLQSNVKGFGLRNLVNRVEILNGKMKIESSINNGTLIEIKIPLEPKL